jgi:hypothetical protein
VDRDVHNRALGDGGRTMGTKRHCNHPPPGFA